MCMILVFTCKGCREVTRLVGEVEDLRQMMESMKRIVTGLGLEEKGGHMGRGPTLFVPGTGHFLNSTCIITNQSSKGIIYNAILTEIIHRQRRNARTIGQHRSEPTAF